MEPDAAAVPSIAELMNKMIQMLAMMQSDKKPEKEHLANCRLDEKVLSFRWEV